MTTKVWKLTRGEEQTVIVPLPLIPRAARVILGRPVTHTASEQGGKCFRVLVRPDFTPDGLCSERLIFWETETKTTR
jgi:hypothetical protein